MATSLNKPVSRLIPKINRIVTLAEDGIYFREPRKRKGLTGPVPYEELEHLAIRLAAIKATNPAAE